MENNEKITFRFVKKDGQEINLAKRLFTCL
ncbi:hypothetical protein ABH957_005590 [Bacillus sp. RC242]